MVHTDRKCSFSKCVPISRPQLFLLLVLCRKQHIERTQKLSNDSWSNSIEMICVRLSCSLSLCVSHTYFFLSFFFFVNLFYFSSSLFFCTFHSSRSLGFIVGWGLWNRVNSILSIVAKSFWEFSLDKYPSIQKHLQQHHHHPAMWKQRGKYSMFFQIQPERKREKERCGVWVHALRILWMNWPIWNIFDITSRMKFFEHFPHKISNISICRFIPYIFFPFFIPLSMALFLSLLRCSNVPFYLYHLLAHAIARGRSLSLWFLYNWQQCAAAKTFTIHLIQTLTHQCNRDRSDTKPTKRIPSIEALATLLKTSHHFN